MLRFEMGNLGDHKSVGRGVWEAHLASGPGYRIYFGKDGPSMILLLLGGDKASQPKDIRQARRFETDCLKDLHKGLAQDLRDPEFAREFLLAAIEEGVSVLQALGKVIRVMGVTEFAAKVGMASPNLLRAINTRHNPTQQTPNRLLKPFGLGLSLAPIEQPKGRRAA